MKVKIVSDKGVVKQGRAELERLFKSLDGEYLIEALPLSNPHTVEEWRKLYFHLRDLVHEEVDTGYTKKEFHDVIKQACLLPMMESLHLFNIPAAPPDLSTKYLTEAGWKEFVGKFKEYVQNNFEIYV